MKYDDLGIKYFVFTNEGKGQYRIPLLDGPCLTADNDIYDEVLDHLCEEINTRKLEHIFGVHDFSTCGEEELIGYSSYEVADEDWERLIGIWRLILHDLGYALGETEYHDRAQNWEEK